jgi:hypothetical protein
MSCIGVPPEGDSQTLLSESAIDMALEVFLSFRRAQGEVLVAAVVAFGRGVAAV